MYAIRSYYVPGALRHRDEHDVHDADAAHEKRYSRDKGDHRGHGGEDGPYCPEGALDFLYLEAGDSYNFV